MKTVLAFLMILIPNFSTAENSLANLLKPLAKTEKRQVIAIVDTGLVINRYTSRYLCDGGHFDATGKGLTDVNGHGTHIAGILAQTIDTDKQCLAIIKWYHNKQSSEAPGVSVALEVAALQSVSKLKPVLVNMSLSGKFYSEKEAVEIKKLLKITTVVVAAGNDGLNLKKRCESFPACSFTPGHRLTLTKAESARYFVVANGTKDSFEEQSNFGGPANVVAYAEDVVSWGLTSDEIGMNTARMTGTSQAAAMFSATEVQLLLQLGDK
jgi:subtilisin family serine protease